ncbi:hypothetical protein [Cryobacterium sp.]|jgi:hypothetical protein|uniref:hypothetical protein n=1 Tax=Cryobacterium sp. TaxID=1926290 RepID=UPI002628F9B3|nr:hypothetical protein [Cryobacterium sp.]MCU1447570.1 hypothetical protein [Cryobacterium sp.]
MRRAYQIICHIIAACVVIQAAVIAWSTFTILNASGDGAALSEDNAPVGFLVHSVVGQMVIPALVLVLLVVALIGRAGIRWAAWLLVAVLVQLILAYSSFELPGLGLLHGINAFVVLGLAEMGARSIGTQSTGARKVRTPAAERTAMDDSA